MTKEFSFKDAFKNLGQAIGGAAAVGVQQMKTVPRRPKSFSVPVGSTTTSSSGPRCTPCRANAMVQAAKKFAKK